MVIRNSVPIANALVGQPIVFLDPIGLETKVIRHQNSLFHLIIVHINGLFCLAISFFFLSKHGNFCSSVVLDGRKYEVSVGGIVEGDERGQTSGGAKKANHGWPVVPCHLDPMVGTRMSIHTDGG
jgi:hypothetical protein